MSYTIEYRRLFLRSEEGYTPCWLAGESNVWEGYGRNQRRVRDWSCFHNLVGVSREDLMDNVKSYLGTDEHWVKNGKWIDDKKYLSWVENGCRKAVTVEEFLGANPNLMSLHCYVSIWENLTHRQELETYVSSSYELDRWIRMYRDFRNLPQNKTIAIYPVIDLGPEDVRFPNKTATSQGDVLLKRKNQYICKADEFSVSWSSDIRDAKVFTWEEYQALIKRFYFLRTVRPVNADVKLQPFNAVIRFADGDHAGSYIMERRKNRLRVCGLAKNAMRYPNEKEAQKTIKSLVKRYPNAGTMSVETISV